MDFGLFGIGLPQILLIMMVALIVFGPERLPGIARQAGRYVNDLRRLTQEARGELQSLTKDLDIRESLKTVQDDLQEIRRDLASTSQDLVRDLQEIKNEVDVRDDITSALNTAGQVSPNVDELSAVEAGVVHPTALENAIDQASQSAEEIGAINSTVDQASLTMAQVATVADEEEAAEALRRQNLIQEAVEQSATDSAIEMPVSPLPVYNPGPLLPPDAPLLNGQHSSAENVELWQRVNALEGRIEGSRFEIFQRMETLEQRLLERLERLEQSLAEPTHSGQN